MTHMMMSSISTACNAIVAPNQTIGGSDAFGEIDIRAVDGTSSGEGLGAMRSALSWQLQDPELHVSGSISVHGVCAADVSRESAGHRSMFALADRDALPHGYSRPGVAQQGGREAAHAARSARQYPGFYSYQRWQAARRQHPRSVDSRGRIVLHHGSRLHRLPTLVSVASGRELLRHPREAQHGRAASLFAPRGPIHGGDLRSGASDAGR